MATITELSRNGIRQQGNFNELDYVVRVKGVDPLSLVPAVRRILAEMNPRIPFLDARTMASIVSNSMQRTSFIMILLGISAAVALLLSAVGMYGVISYLVTQRRFEIGGQLFVGDRGDELVDHLADVMRAAIALGDGEGVKREQSGHDAHRRLLA